MITGRDCLNKICKKQVPERLTWTTVVDSHTINILPDNLRTMNPVEFNHYLGCDTVDLSGWGLPWQLEGARLVQPGVETRNSRDDAGNFVTETICSQGKLTSRMSPAWHPVEFPVKTIEDIRLMIKRWELSYYEPVDEIKAYESIENIIGDSGITTIFAMPSAIPWLLENVMGVEEFYYMLDDYPDEMKELIKIIDDKNWQRYEIIAEHPCPVAILAENTSTRYIGPKIYEEYNMPSQRAFVDAMHNKGKTAILHMCGHVNDLLPLIKETGTDGIHALTPPPLGDTLWEKALDILGDDLIIMGILTPDIFHTIPIKEVSAALDKVITPRIKESPFVLSLFADGIPVPLERFLAVKKWVENN